MYGIKVKGQVVARANRVSNLEGDPRRKVVFDLADDASAQWFHDWARHGKGEGEMVIEDDSGREVGRFYLILDGTIGEMGFRVPCTIRP